MEVGFLHTQGYNAEILTYANMIPTRDGGTHLTAFKSAYSRALNQYAKKAGLNKEKGPQPTGDDLLEGLYAVVSVKLPNPQFEGQTKGKLLNPEAGTAVGQVVYERLLEILEENPRIAKAVYEKALRAAQAREAARKARELVRRQNPLESDELPGKLADCQTENPEEAELFIVEGDSAGGAPSRAGTAASRPSCPSGEDPQRGEGGALQGPEERRGAGHGLGHRRGHRGGWGGPL